MKAPARIDQRHEGMKTVRRDERLNQRPCRRRAGCPIEDLAGDARVGNRRARREKSRRARVPHISPDVGQPAEKDHAVWRVVAPAMRWLHRDCVAVPRHTRHSIPRRDEEQVRQCRRRRRLFRHDLIEMEDHLFRLDANGARVRNDGHDLRRRDSRGPRAAYRATRTPEETTPRRSAAAKRFHLCRELSPALDPFLFLLALRLDHVRGRSTDEAFVAKAL